MTEEERNELITARGTGLAAMACIQQLCRVLQERGIMTTEQLHDAISEALAMVQTLEPKRPIEAEINRVAAVTIRNAFEDRRG
ncbi:MAG: hypothetical protein H6852_02170 [Geminicoccaceae bacterium]|nr:hypothetical protein [Geminicoccaceae bacterium]HRY24077.1 hypothetical protein [Geminicoccaceae bacterium]